MSLQRSYVASPTTTNSSSKLFHLLLEFEVSVGAVGLALELILAHLLKLLSAFPAVNLQSNAARMLHLSVTLYANVIIIGRR